MRGIRTYSKELLEWRARLSSDERADLRDALDPMHGIDSSAYSVANYLRESFVVEDMGGLEKLVAECAGHHLSFSDFFERAVLNYGLRDDFDGVSRGGRTYYNAFVADSGGMKQEDIGLSDIELAVEMSAGWWHGLSGVDVKEIRDLVKSQHEPSLGEVAGAIFAAARLEGVVDRDLFAIQAIVADGASRFQALDRVIGRIEESLGRDLERSMFEANEGVMFIDRARMHYHQHLALRGIEGELMRREASFEKALGEDEDLASGAAEHLDDTRLVLVKKMFEEKVIRRGNLIDPLIRMGLDARWSFYELLDEFRALGARVPNSDDLPGDLRMAYCGLLAAKLGLEVNGRSARVFSASEWVDIAVEFGDVERVLEGAMDSSLPYNEAVALVVSRGQELDMPPAAETAVKRGYEVAAGEARLEHARVSSAKRVQQEAAEAARRDRREATRRRIPSGAAAPVGAADDESRAKASAIDQRALIWIESLGPAEWERLHGVTVARPGTSIAEVVGALAAVSGDVGAMAKVVHRSVSGFRAFDDMLLEVGSETPTTRALTEDEGLAAEKVYNELLFSRRESGAPDLDPLDPGKFVRQLKSAVLDLAVQQEGRDRADELVAGLLAHFGGGTIPRSRAAVKDVVVLIERVGRGGPH